MLQEHHASSLDSPLGWDCSPSSSPHAYLSPWRPSADPDTFCSASHIPPPSDSLSDGWDAFDHSNPDVEESLVDEDSDQKCAGLLNLGNTCFLNAVLQCLTYTVPLANTMLRNKHSVSCQFRGFCGMCAIEDHIKAVFGTFGGTVSPSYLAGNLNQISKSFIPGEQQDAHECFFLLIDILQKSCNFNGDFVSNMTEDKSFISEIFIGQIRSQVRCNSCLHSSDSVEAFLGLSLDVESCDSIEEALSNFMAVEELEEEEKASCSNCNVKSSRSKGMRIDESPQVLVIQLKRFKTSSMLPTKIDKTVSYGLSLDLTPYVSRGGDDEQINECDWKYRLYAVLVHSGWSITYGHYYCYVQTSPGIWHWMNDSVVNKVTEKTVLDQEAYMLFYVREGIKQELHHQDALSVEPNCRPCGSSITSIPASAIENDNSHSNPEVLKVMASEPINEIENDDSHSNPEVLEVVASEPLNDIGSKVDNAILDGSSGQCINPSSPDQELVTIEIEGDEKAACCRTPKEKLPVILTQVTGDCTKPALSQLVPGKPGPIFSNKQSTDLETGKNLHPLRVNVNASLDIQTQKRTSPFSSHGGVVLEQSFKQLLRHMPSKRRQAFLNSVSNGQEVMKQNSEKENRTLNRAKACDKVKKKTSNEEESETLYGCMDKRNGKSQMQEKPWSNDCSQAVSRKMQRVGGKRVMASFFDSGLHQKVHGVMDR